MKKTIAVLFLGLTMLWPLACGKSIPTSATTSGPTTIIVLFPTDTPTFTLTPTKTATTIFTVTATKTPTGTPTFTGTATATNTLTITPTGTLSPTLSPTATASPTNTRTFTNTFSPTPIPTNTYTPTFVPTFTTNFVGQWGYSGGFSGPAGICLDNSGDIFVAVANSNQVMEFTTGGVLENKWGAGVGGVTFVGPTGVCIAGGNLTVTDSLYGIQSYNGTSWSQIGSVGTGASQDKNPLGLVYGSNLYVADNGNGRVDYYNGSSFTSSWAGGVTPAGIAVDSSNNVYVTDPVANKVDKYNSTGTLITSWNGGGGTNNLNQPYGIAIVETNYVFVADTGNSRIEIFDLNGNYLGQFGSPGTGAGLLSFPRGIAADSNGNIYVADTGNDLIQVFTVNITQSSSGATQPTATPSGGG